MNPVVSSVIVVALERAWAAIRQAHPDVPEVVLVVASGSMGKTLRWGHYAPRRWARDDLRAAEVLISGEGLRRGGADVLGTLLHEAAHGLAAARGLQDTSRNGRYHNKIFKKFAEELGLEVTSQGSRGLAETSVPPATAQRWATTVKMLDEAVQKAFRHQEHRGKGEKQEARQLLASCACGRKIRVARAVYDVASIVCGACKEEFELQN